LNLVEPDNELDHATITLAEEILQATATSLRDGLLADGLVNMKIVTPRSSENTSTQAGAILTLKPRFSGGVQLCPVSTRNTKLRARQGISALR
jgi:hypothetical protein